MVFGCDNQALISAFFGHFGIYGIFRDFARAYRSGTNNERDKKVLEP